jgi:hypothetical protein
MKLGHPHTSTGDQTTALQPAALKKAHWDSSGAGPIFSFF